MRRYRAAWETEPQFSGWLTCSEGDGTKAFCKLCKCTLQAHKKDLSNHSKCKKHVQAFKFSVLGSSNSKLTTFYDADIPKDRKIAELKVAAYITEHCSVSAVDHLGDLLPTLDKESQLLSGIKLHHTKCAGLITNVISPCMLDVLLNDIGDSLYSMIIDESTSIDTKKMMCIIVRYYSQNKKKIITTFYRLLEVEGGDADTLTNEFKKQLATDGLDINKLIGIGIDGANVMVGEHHSFSSILNEALPHLTTVKCVSHSLHLAAENACKVLPSHLEYIVREVHNWFSYSTKRQIDYALLHEALAGKKPLKIDKLSGTRWLARVKAITKILEQWDALELHFRLAKDKERCYTAGQLHLMLSSKHNQLYFLFLKQSLKAITDCNRMFQADNVEPLKLFTELHGLLLNYLSILVPPERLNSVRRQDLAGFNFKDCVMNIECIHLGCSFNEATGGIDQNELRIIKERCVLFLCQICQEIQKRIPKNLMLLEKISFFCPVAATSQVRPDVGDILTNFKELLGADSIESALNEWRVLPFQQWNNANSSAEIFWGEVAAFKDAAGEHKFSTLSNLVTGILSLPFSNASVERAFSVMNVVKNKLRNKMHSSTADHIIRVRYSLKNGGCVRFEPTEKMLSKFNSVEVYKANTNNEIDEDVALIYDCNK